MKKLIPKNKRLLESINATKEDISTLYYVVMLYNVSIHFEKKIFKRPNNFLKWCSKEHKKQIKSIKSPYSQFVFSQMNDGILYTDEGVQIPLRYVLRSVREGGYEINNINDLIRTHINNFESDIVWDVFEKIADSYMRLE